MTRNTGSVPDPVPSSEVDVWRLIAGPANAPPTAPSNPQMVAGAKILLRLAFSHLKYERITRP